MPSSSRRSGGKKNFLAAQSKIETQKIKTKEKKPMAENEKPKEQGQDDDIMQGFMNAGQIFKKILTDVKTQAEETKDRMTKIIADLEGKLDNFQGVIDSKFDEIGAEQQKKLEEFQITLASGLQEIRDIAKRLEEKQQHNESECKRVETALNRFAKETIARLANLESILRIKPESAAKQENQFENLNRLEIIERAVANHQEKFEYIGGINSCKGDESDGKS